MGLRHLFGRWKARWLERLVDAQMPQIVHSRKELLQVFDGLTIPIANIDRQYTVRRVNKAMLAALNRTSFADLIYKPCYQVLHGLKERCPQCTAPVTFRSGEETSRFGLLEGNQNPKEPIYKITCYPTKDQTGEVTSVAEYYGDSTDIANMTRELYESERARVMEPLAAGLAHQIRQPLTIIRSSGQYLSDTYGDIHPNDDFKETLESIVQNADNVDEILADFSHFSKPSEYHLKETVLTPVLEKGLKLVAIKARDARILIDKEIASPLPMLLLDEKLFLQAYLNLLVNSIESMPRGGGQLTVKAWLEEKTPPAKVCVTIQDTGEGIPKELISRIFQPFVTSKEGGCGLGLPIAEGIIRSHGGHIQFDSNEKQGTKVLIELPLAWIAALESS